MKAKNYAPLILLFLGLIIAHLPIVRNFTVIIMQPLHTLSNTLFDNSPIRTDLSLVGIVSEQRQSKAESEAGLVANVIRYDPALFRDRIQVDRGRSDGIRIGQAVVCNGVLVGVVDEVLRDSAFVSLLSDSNSSVAAIIEGTNTDAVIHGGIAAAQVERVPAQLQAEGKKVYTSGIDGLPAGIPIGAISEKVATDRDVYSSFVLASPVVFENIRQVEVIRK